jgi:hypothetical protein
VETLYRISYQSGQVQFELESSDETWVEKKEKQYLDLLKGASAISLQKERGGADSSSALTKAPISGSITVQEFYTKYIKSNKITSRPNIAVFFLYYLQKLTGKQDIITQDVVQCFAEIGYPSYNKINMTDTLNQAKRKALLNNINKTWSLTSTGEDFVLNLISSGE